MFQRDIFDGRVMNHCLYSTEISEATLSPGLLGCQAPVSTASPILSMCFSFVLGHLSIKSVVPKTLLFVITHLNLGCSAEQIKF